MLLALDPLRNACKWAYPIVLHGTSTAIIVTCALRIVCPCLDGTPFAAFSDGVLAMLKSGVTDNYTPCLAHVTTMRASERDCRERRLSMFDARRRAVRLERN